MTKIIDFLMNVKLYWQISIFGILVALLGCYLEQQNVTILSSWIVGSTVLMLCYEQHK